MRIKITSVFVEDQEKALQFYTEVLGFQKKMDMPAGDYKWLTVVSPEDPDGVELLLEPNDNDAAKTYQKVIYEQGIPITSFVVDDIHAEYDRLKKHGVEFSMEPTDAGPVMFAIFDDTCGNLIQISQAR
ncbi:Catechol 2,3-dioxygenase [Lentibacillus halodurans]|uniref:Catechol 2,3-dioxygenase n=1 Tax=Lentibacillus halodurans TaxID=237679 RepID=A0A1I0ZV87_9BACI|nr:VOC family protein [Lentibacillus halodurans]SFB28350.1 Catechol 2,3-dioxygenase [Lentibacillus halodurans]